MFSGLPRKTICEETGALLHEDTGFKLNIDDLATSGPDTYERGYKDGRAAAAQMLQDHINRGNGAITDGMVTAVHG